MYSIYNLCVLIWCFKGDSGSGLICIHNGVLSIVGIISYGLDCGVDGLPGVYTTVASTSNANFVESVLKNQTINTIKWLDQLNVYFFL